MRGKAETLGWPLSARIGWFTGPRTPTGCREWLSGTNDNGYPTLSVNSKTRYVTRLILGLTPSDGRRRVAMHICDNPICVEPSHLRIGTPRENMQDKAAKGRSAPALSVPASSVQTIRAMRFAGRTLDAIVKRTGVSMSHVSRIARLKSRTA